MNDTSKYVTLCHNLIAKYLEDDTPKTFNDYKMILNQISSTKGKMPDPLFKEILNFATTRLFNEVWDYNINAEISDDIDTENYLQEAKITFEIFTNAELAPYLGELPSPDTVSDTAKKCIFSCYLLMNNYIHSENADSEIEFDKLSDAIDGKKNIIPPVIFDRIQHFVEYELYEMCYIEAEVEQLGPEKAVLTEGGIQLKDENAARELMYLYFQKVEKLLVKFNRFVEEELTPYFPTKK